MPSSLAAILRNDSKQLQAVLGLDSSSARIEVQCLLQTVLHVNRAYLLTHPEQALNDDQYAQYTGMLERRLHGEPIAYILGEREFFGLDFRVSPATLIPRPDTELLVELALQRIPAQETCRVLDMGTGSGAIALSIAHARPEAEVTAVDASPEALEVARENARRLLAQHISAHTSTGSVRTDLDLCAAMDSCKAAVIGNVRLLSSNWFSALPGERFDLIVSNPPYIAADDAHLAQGDVRFEPLTALASGADGLDDIRRIIAEAKAHLHNGGWLMFEHGYDQAKRVRGLLDAAGFIEVFSARDLAGIERVTGGRTGSRQA